MAITYSKKMLIERIRRHMADGFPNNDFSISQNEVLLMIDSAIASRIVGHAFENYKIEGALAVPEAYIITYALSVPTLNTNTMEYEVAMPQPPLSLPLGHSVTNIYFGGTKGKSQPVFMVKAKRAAYRDYMPKPTGILARIEGATLILSTSNGQPLNPLVNTLYITMPSARTTDVTAPMNVADDDITYIFEYCVKQIMQRMGIPKDVVQDGITAGRTNVTP